MGDNTGEVEDVLDSGAKHLRIDVKCRGRGDKPSTGSDFFGCSLIFAVLAGFRVLADCAVFLPGPVPSCAPDMLLV